MFRNYFLLSVIISFSFCLQIYGINHGLPHHFDHDESLIVESAMRTGLGDFSPPHSGWPASLHKYVLFFIYGIYFIAGKLLGIFSDVNDFSKYFLLEPGTFYFIARLVSVFSGGLAILVIYLISNKLYNKKIALLSSLLLCATFTFIDLCHSAKQDVTMVLFLLLSFLSISLITKTGLKKYYILAGVFAGLAISEKYNAGFVVIPIITSHYIWKSINRESLKRPILENNLFMAFLALGITFVLCNPYLIVNAEGLWSGLRSLLFDYSSLKRVGIQQSSVNPYIYLVTNVLRNGFGIILETVVLIGLIYCIYRRKKEDLLVLSFIIPYMLVAGAMKSMAPHHLLPVVPLLVIVGSKFLYDAINWIVKDDRFKNIAIGFVPILIVSQPIYKVLSYDHLISHKDTREVAKEWIENNIKPGSIVAVEDGTYSPALTRSKENLSKELLNAKSMGGGRAIKILLNLNEENYPKITYDIIGIWKPNEGYFIQQWDRTAEDVLNDLKQKNVEYIIVNSYSYDRYFNDETLRNLYSETEPRRKFYQLLKKEQTIIKNFESNMKDRPGPNIYIYQVK